ncbi:MAG: M81 family metallopeptidase [Nitratireductor sp.]|nr:M81 family metallopeptidase [Nitratireductor sp.]
MRPYRIAIAGFQHETNTFAPGSAGVEEFRMADSWPGLLVGDAVVSETHGMNLPVAGAVSAAQECGRVELVPILWCAAEPSGRVTDEAFEWIAGMILDGVRAAGPLDAVYLDLHGAMVTDSYDDGEGELLRRMRDAVGPALPIGVSLDLHANVTPAMIQMASLMTIYRTYPHLDMADTGARCLNELLRNLDGTPHKAAFRQAPFLVPLNAQSTDLEPCRTLYGQLDSLPMASGQYVELAMGFTAADIHDCGPSVVAYAETEDDAAALADAMLGQLCEQEGVFDTNLMDAHDAVRIAMQNPAGAPPVVIADVQDNPGAGGTSDTTGLLQALIDLGAQDALLGVMHDPQLAQKAHEAGVGSIFDDTIGGKSGLAAQSPVTGRIQVLALSDGVIAYTGEMYGGGTASIGPSCLVALRENGSEIRIVVSSVRTQCLDRALFAHFGADPSSARIVCVKSTAHFRADFEPISSAILNVAVPGAFPCQLHLLAFRQLREHVRLGPCGPEMRSPN